MTLLINKVNINVFAILKKAFVNVEITIYIRRRAEKNEFDLIIYHLF